MMKRIISLLSALFLVLAACMIPLSAYADTPGKTVISDDADLLSPEEETALLSVMEPITSYGNIAFASVPEKGNPGTADAYAERFYQNTFGLTDGGVFLVDMDNRKIYIYCQDFFYEIITTNRSETITDNIYKYASRGEYYECAAEAFREMNTLLEGGKIAQPMKYVSNGLLALILALLINFIIVRSVTKLRAPRQKDVLAASKAFFEGSEGTAVFTHTTRKYDPIQTSSGGGGGRSGGGGGFSGGGHSGGGGGHSF